MFDPQRLRSAAGRLSGRWAVGRQGAAALSFVWPGLGQLAMGRRRAAAVLATPALLVFLYIASRLVGRLDLAAITLLDPSFAAFLLIVVVVMAGWRTFAVVDAWRTRPSRPTTPRDRGVVSALIVAILLSHALVGYYAWAFYDAGRQIFTGDVEPTSPPPTPSPTPNPSATPAPPTPTPEPTIPPSDRISILLTGVDSGHDRNHALTDTMLVVTVSPSKGTVAMMSFPRDIAEFPLYFGGTYHDKLNSLQTAVRNNPAKYPDGPSETLANELAYLLGIPIQYTASINLVGFERMVNLVGGVDVVVERAITDPHYDWFDGTYGFFLSAGKHHLDGRTALAFVRSRMGAGDNDFTRARRQQQLLVALKEKLTNPGVIAKLPQLLDAAAKTVTTNLPPDKAHEYLDLASSIDEANISRYVLGPPYAVHPPTNTTGGTYILRLDLPKVAALSVELFGTDSRYFGTLPSASP